MKQLIIPQVLVLCFISCFKDDGEIYTHSDLNCSNLEIGLQNSDRDIVLAEINSQTQDLLANPSQSDSFGQKENLMTLINRLNEKCPEINATKICFACILTNPPQSEIKIELDSFGVQNYWIIDISTPDDSILRAVNMHK